MSNQAKSSSGVTLIEVVVTATFVATVVIAIIEMFISIANLNRQARNMTIVTQLAHEQVEKYRNAGFYSIPASDDFADELPDNLGSPKGATTNFVDLDPPQAGLKQLNVVIYYHEGSKQKNIQVSTYIAERGINR